MTPKREELIELRETQGLTREKIAEKYDVSLATVRRWIKEFKIPRPTKSKMYLQSPKFSTKGAIIAEPLDGFTLMEKAQQKLGDRLKEKRNVGYILDGKPASIYVIMEAAHLEFPK